MENAASASFPSSVFMPFAGVGVGGAGYGLSASPSYGGLFAAAPPTGG